MAATVATSLQAATAIIANKRADTAPGRARQASVHHDSDIAARVTVGRRTRADTRHQPRLPPGYAGRPGRHAPTETGPARWSSIGTRIHHLGSPRRDGARRSSPHPATAGCCAACGRSLDRNFTRRFFARASCRRTRYGESPRTPASVEVPSPSRCACATTADRSRPWSAAWCKPDNGEVNASDGAQRCWAAQSSPGVQLAGSAS